MSKKSKIIVVSIIGVALIFFAIAFLISSNKKYTITFDTDGGSYIASQKIKKGEFVTKPVEPIKTGYKFVEWQYEDKEYDFKTKVKEDMTLKAIWEKDKKYYNVELTVDDKKQTIRVQEGETIDEEKLTFEEKIGYEIEWQHDDQKFDIENDKITEDIELTGKYVEVKTYNVIFDASGGSAVENQKVNENRKVKKPTNPTRDGYIFDGWYLNNKLYDFDEKVTSDITLKAKWSDDANAKRYTVTFDSNYGSAVGNQTVLEGRSASRPNNPWRDGYRFVEWQLNGRTYDFNSRVTSNITLKAVWEEVVTYTVSFNSKGGTTFNDQRVESGGRATNPGNPTRDGYVFIGWDFDFNTPITSNVTINASWRTLYKFTVDFNLKGGTCASCEEQIITEGGKAKNPGNPTRSGYNFAGWDFDFNEVITDDTTINAKWNEIVYVIKSSAVDQYSPDVTLTVWNGDTQITNYQSINYTDGVQMCSSSNPTVSKNDFANESSFIVILNDGTRVRATK